MTTKKLRRGSDRKSGIIQEILDAPVTTDLLPNRRQIRQFLSEYVGNVPIDDLVGRDPAIMARIALDHLAFGANRRKGQAKLRIYNPTVKTHGYESAYTFVEMVNDDMPFLVDSVTAAINGRDLGVHITVHPIVRIRRDSRGRIREIGKADDKTAAAESFIRLAIDREADKEQLKLLEKDMKRVLKDVRLAVRDWKTMRDKMQEVRKLLVYGPPGADESLRQETAEFLQWMAEDHFTFLGYREYELERDGNKALLKPVPDTGLGLLAKSDSGHTIVLTPEMRRITRAKDWLIITKANSRSTVHRNAYLDYVGVKVFDENGVLRGERRFIGLYTSVAYSESPRNIPLLRHKVDRVLDRAAIDPGTHRGKALLHILNTYPRDELFQSTTQDLMRTSLGILNLQDRQRVKFFVRRDPFRRFFSCLVFVPRDKYTTDVRQRIESILTAEFDGTTIDSSVKISDAALARVHIVVHTRAGDRRRISTHRIEQRISEVVVTWSDRLRDRLNRAFGPDDGPVLFSRYRDVFPPGYQSEVTPADACSDVRQFETMLGEGCERSVDLYAPEDSPRGHMHFLVYSLGEPLILSEALPLLENMGVDVYTEHPYALKPTSGKAFWIQDFDLRQKTGKEFDIDAVEVRFEQCFLEVLSGRAENDGLNRLILSTDLDCREISLLRCYLKYLLQLGLPFSQAYMESVLDRHAEFANLLVRQFQTQFDPAIGVAERNRRLADMAPAVTRAVSRAGNVDEDRILTALAGAVKATLRSNYYLRDEDGGPKPCISVKLDPTQLREVPLPKPKFEIFVYSPEVEGVHLRNGEIARGGIRWSDRREDFRTEVLGLMKAQVVKNTVIVPTGAKGGFFPKRAPAGDRDAILQNGIHCYKTFIRGLLDITDNVVDGNVVTPKNVVRRDGDDPYLVVAADKGTASFSDIANEISASYGFWLDDAFASGGSAGYDHKKMGITARGAWEAVKRHFRESGVDIQKEPFTVLGIGDMSGDVFGNGLLLSRKIRLVAAFNHQHIFLDPDPDIAASFKERQRLFRLSRSGWIDYDDKLISKGGGVFSRQAKTIRLSPEARRLLDTDQVTMQPDELIRTMLRMRVDLLWNGGIGTYVKASNEGHADVGDRSNDTVRVNADELRCKVVGEGGNLGLTQRARIEYSLKGGRINTDFIDNSGGVDSSDREVNIKILLSAATKQQGLSRKKRNTLLASMTDDVAELVLRNNYLQTQAISMTQVRSTDRIDLGARLIKSLEATGLLDRELEFLPNENEIEERRARRQGFTRPETAVILSYAKIDLYNGLIESGESLEDFLVSEPPRYFPAVLRKRYADLLPAHHLSRQILATLLANDLVNRMGPVFARRLQDDTDVDIVTVARAYAIARQVCGMRPLFHTIESLDNQLPASAQMTMLFELSRTLRHACYWLIERYDSDLDIGTLVERLKPGMTTMYTRTGGVMSRAARQRHQSATAKYIELGASEALANKMSSLLLTRAALDIADLAATHDRDVLETAALYSAFNDELGLFWLHVSAEDLKVKGRWQALARNNLREEFYQIRRELAAQFMRKRSKQGLDAAIQRWLKEHSADVKRFKEMVEEMKLRGPVDIATLSVAAKSLRDLIT